MAIHLSNLSSHPHKKRKVIGRGNGSGHGTYSGKGQKGQRARSGGRKNLYRRGLKMFLQQLPKSRGFSSFYPRYRTVNVGDLEKKYSDGAVITKDSLVQAGLLTDKKNPVKVLGSGSLKKKLTINADAFSQSARKAIEAAGGHAASPVVRQAGKQKAA
ncbi:MAG: 50S ribosomal protein L15 [Patescibacteria group bacterium]